MINTVKKYLECSKMYPRLRKEVEIYGQNIEDLDINQFQELLKNMDPNILNEIVSNYENLEHIIQI